MKQQSSIGDKVIIQMSVASGHEFNTTLFEPHGMDDKDIERRIELYLQTMSFIDIVSWDWWREGDK